MFVRLALMVMAAGLTAAAVQATVPITLASTGSQIAAPPAEAPVADPPPYLEAGLGAAALAAAALLARRRKPLPQVVS